MIEPPSSEAAKARNDIREAGTQSGEKGTSSELFEGFGFASLNDDIRKEERRMLYAMLASVFGSVEPPL